MVQPNLQRPGYSLKPLLVMAIICLGIILYFYSSPSVRLSSDDLAEILSHSPQSVIQEPESRIYVNLMLFLQAGIGLTFVAVPLVIIMYRNRALLSRLHRRVQYVQDRKVNTIVVREPVEAPEDYFFHRLLQAHPDLTSHEIKLCSLLRQNYSSQEIAEKLNITRGSVNTARYRLRKKLTLQQEADLIIYLRKIA